MLKKFLFILSEKNRAKLIFYFVLSLIFVGIETSILVIIYPLIDVFLGLQQLDQNKVFNLLSDYTYIKNFNNLITFSIILIIIRVIYFLVFNWIKYSYLNQLQKDLALRIFNHFHARTYLQITKSSSAAFIRDISSETTTFKKFCDTYINLVIELLIASFISIFLFIVSPQVFTYLIIFLLFFASIYFLIILKVLRLLGKKRVIINKKIIKVVSESYKFFEFIKLNKISKLFSFDLKNEFYKLVNLNRNFQIIKLIPKLFIETTLFLGFMMIFLIQIKNVGFEINMSIAGIFLVSFLRLFPSVSKILLSIQDLNLFKFSIENIYNQVTLSSIDKDYNDRPEKKINFENTIEIKDLNFSYEEKEVLKKIHLKIQKNTFNAIIGKSGSGKSSFIKIFMGLLKPSKIDFKIDGKNLDIYKNNDWQTKIGYASQNSLILNQSLKRNITMSDENTIDDEKLKDSFFNAGLNTFLNFEKNIDDELNESGSNFSGGQLQRVSLARALYFSKGVLILDEICSALDIESEKKIIMTLKKLSKTYTIIYITHRNNFHEYFDNIIEIQ